MLAQGAKDKIFPHDLKIQGGLTYCRCAYYIYPDYDNAHIYINDGRPYLFCKEDKDSMAMRATSQDMRMAGLRH